MMPGLIHLAEAYLVERALTDGWLFPRKNKTAMLLLAIASVLAITAAGFMIAGLHAYLSTQYTADLANLFTAGGILVLAAITALIGMGFARKRQIKKEMIKHDLKRDLQNIIAAVDDELGDQVRDNPAAAVGLAALAGFILADRVL